MSKRLNIMDLFLAATSPDIDHFSTSSWHQPQSNNGHAKGGGSHAAQVRHPQRLPCRPMYTFVNNKTSLIRSINFQHYQYRLMFTVLSHLSIIINVLVQFYKISNALIHFRTRKINKVQSISSFYGEKYHLKLFFVL